jgi:predicted transcriptional regulator
MENDIELICDDQGLAVIGETQAVERFLRSEGLSSKSLDLPQLRSMLSGGATAAQAGSEIAANSGRWVKLTKESAEMIEKYGLRENAKSGLGTGVIKGKGGQVKGFVEFVKGPGAALTNPAVLAGAAGIMAQLAMQQAMDEITDYLAVIDQKVDDVLRAQKDAVLARMIGVGLVIDEAMMLRESRGRVDEVTWSKVQGAPATIAETQAYALRQLDALAESLEVRGNLGDLAKVTKDAEPRVQEWLAVLARCFQLQDGVAILELDRVLDASPDEVDGHRMGLKAAREKRLDAIAITTRNLIERMDLAAGTANKKVLFHPGKPREMVDASNQVGVVVADFHGRLGIEGDRESLEARRWAAAAAEVRDQALRTGGDGVDAAKRFGSEAVGRTRSMTDKLSSGLAERTFRRRNATTDVDVDD